jgi:hypothetical protein
MWDAVPRLFAAAADALNLDKVAPLAPLTQQHQQNLDRHRTRHRF